MTDIDERPRGSFWDPDAAEPGTSLSLVPTSATAGALVPAAATIDLAPRAWMVAQKIAGTPFVPDTLRNKPEAVLACMLVGNELGLPLMQALAKIHIINGRPGLAAETMRALVLAAGHDIWIEEKSRTAVTVGGKRRGESREQRVTWTMDDAAAAGLVSSANYKKYPRAMLTARATAELCRDKFPDITGGLYSVEELGDGFDPSRPEEEVAPAGPVEQAVRKASSPAARKRLSQRAKAAAAEGPEPAAPPLPEEDDEDIVDAEVVETEPGDDAPPPLPEEDGEPPQIVKDLQAKVDKAEASMTRAQTMTRAQKIAMRANELGVDRHHVIAAVTAGAKTSGNELDEGEADLVDEALRRLKVGEIRLVDGDYGWQLVDAPPVDNEDRGGEPDGIDEPPDGPAWRAHIKASGKTVSATTMEARRIANELEVPAPGSAAEFAEADPELRRRLLGWLAGGEA